MTVWLPSKTYWIVLLRLFSFKFCHILSTVGFINEDNYCHSQRIGQLIKENLLKGIFKVDWLINVAANTQISPSLLLTSAICKQTVNFFARVLFWMLGVRLIHECGLYTSLYGTTKTQTLSNIPASTPSNSTHFFKLPYVGPFSIVAQNRVRKLL